MRGTVIVAMCWIAGNGLLWHAALMIGTAFGRYRDEAEATRKANLLLYRSNLALAAECRLAHEELQLLEALRVERMAAYAQAHTARFVADPPDPSDPSTPSPDQRIA